MTRIVPGGDRLRVLARRVLAPAAGVVRVRTAQNVVALTFDDGPDPVGTPAVLDVLARYEARATFFMNGSAAARHPDLVRRVVEEGHETANHAWSHRSFLLERPPARTRRRWMQQEILATSAAVGEPATTLFRPPFGHIDAWGCLVARSAGHRTILWHVAAADWADTPADDMALAVSGRLCPGAIVLFHDALQRPRETRFVARDDAVASLDQVLAASRDYRWVTVTELLQSGEPELRFRRSVGDPALLPPVT